MANDSILQGETLLRKAIQLSEESEDWHTNYIAYQRLAEALSQSNHEEALRLMKTALTIYEQHPDDERNYVILLDYAGTYAAQMAFNTEGSYDEALDFIHRAYNIALKKRFHTLLRMQVTLCPQANLYAFGTGILAKLAQVLHVALQAFRLTVTSSVTIVRQEPAQRIIVVQITVKSCTGTELIIAFLAVQAFTNASVVLLTLVVSLPVLVDHETFLPFLSRCPVITIVSIEVPFVEAELGQQNRIAGKLIEIAKQRYSPLADHDKKIQITGFMSQSGH